MNALSRCLKGFFWSDNCNESFSFILHRGSCSATTTSSPLPCILFPSIYGCSRFGLRPSSLIFLSDQPCYAFVSREHCCTSAVYSSKPFSIPTRACIRYIFDEFAFSRRYHSAWCRRKSGMAYRRCSASKLWPIRGRDQADMWRAKCAVHKWITSGFSGSFSSTLLLYPLSRGIHERPIFRLEILGYISRQLSMSAIRLLCARRTILGSSKLVTVGRISCRGFAAPAGQVRSPSFFAV